MRKINLICVVLLVIICKNSLYSIYNTVNWSDSGYDDSQNIDSVMYVSSVSGLDSALQNKNPKKLTRIVLSAGTYDFGNSYLKLDSNVIISSNESSPEDVKLLFNLGDTYSSYACIRVYGETIGSTISIDENFPNCINFGSDYLVLDDASTINPGDFIKLYVDNDDVWGKDTVTSNNDFIGQMFVVTSKTNDVIYLDDSLHLDFRNYPNESASWEDLNPRIQKIRPAHDVGINNIYIGLADSASSKNGSHIVFSYALNCYISDIVSCRPTFYHVSIGRSYRITVEGSYFKKGNIKYGGGQAYGILLSNSSTHCLIENNNFYWLRHAICFAGGANGNVAGYNCSWRTVFDDDDSTYYFQLTDFPCADYYFHGRYPFANLVEGNIGHYIQFENTWGSNGPFNMIFKNMTHDQSESFGLQVNAGHPYQNIIGNYITYKVSYISFLPDDYAQHEAS